MEQDTRRARQALRNFQRLLTLEPNHTGHLEQLARLTAELGQPRQASRYWLQRAEVLAERDEPGAALGSVHLALETDPRNDRARALLERLRAATPAGEILMPEGPDPSLLPVNDDLLAVDSGLFDDRDTGLDSVPPAAHPSFLPPTRRGRNSGAPAGHRGDIIADVAARLSAGLVRRENISGRPAALDAAPTGGNELISDLARADGQVEGEITRDFTVDRIDAALVGDMASGAPVASDEILTVRSDEFEVVSSLGDLSAPQRTEPTMFDVSADDVLEIRPETGAMEPITHRNEMTLDDSLDSMDSLDALDSLDNFSLGGSFNGSTVDLHASDIDTDRPTDPPVGLRPPEDFDPGPSTDTAVDQMAPEMLGAGRSQVLRLGGRAIPVGAVFAPLPRPVLEELVEQADRRTVRVGVTVVRAGDRFEGPLLLVRGRVSCEAGADDRRPALLPPVEPGEVVGLVELVRGGRWRASVRAELECEMLALPVRAVDTARGEHPAWEKRLREAARRQLAEQLLAASGLFGHMSVDQRATLGQRFTVRMFAPGDVLIKPGQRADGLYLVIAGEVDVERERAYLTTLGEGDFVGVVAALEKAPTEVRAVAATPVEAFYLDPAAIQVALRVPEVHAAFKTVVERRRTVLEGGQY